MPFRYRLEKILSFRIKKKDEQLEKVRKAQMEVARVEGMIQANQKQIEDTRNGMRMADAMMLQHYDRFLNDLYVKENELRNRKEAAKRYLQEQIDILQEREKEVKVLEKHREKKLEEYKEEQKRIELKQLNEVGSLRHFAKTRQEQEEQELDEQQQLEELNSLEKMSKLGLDTDEQSGF